VHNIFRVSSRLLYVLSYFQENVHFSQLYCVSRSERIKCERLRINFWRLALDRRFQHIIIIKWYDLSIFASAGVCTDLHWSCWCICKCMHCAVMLLPLLACIQFSIVLKLLHFFQWWFVKTVARCFYFRGSIYMLKLCDWLNVLFLMQIRLLNLEAVWRQSASSSFAIMHKSSELSNVVHGCMGVMLYTSLLQVLVTTIMSKSFKLIKPCR